MICDLADHSQVLHKVPSRALGFCISMYMFGSGVWFMAACFTCTYSTLVTEVSPNPCTALRLASGHTLKITNSWPLSGIMSHAGPSVFSSTETSHHQSLSEVPVSLLLGCLSVRTCSSLCISCSILIQCWLPCIKIVKRDISIISNFMMTNRKLGHFSKNLTIPSIVANDL